MTNGNETMIEFPELLEQLQHITAEAVKTETVDATVPLSEIGIDSLNIVEVIIGCEEIYSDFQIDPSRLEFDEMTSLLDIHNQMIAFEMVV
ncbi:MULTISPECIES: phosphopantetheine-binding protein [Pseudomonas]|uniref:Phosphopantetheine attachment site n=2 Tax=Pseudomonas costantinii TaxID=168469 RepID=A0A1H4YKH5_9PSED|nr:MULTISPECIES: phosphopantetheine-binding protein [Pseudomonas]MCU1727316.1 phosphopantetheine-binding protein [Pseudomonas sp. 7P_10.2_Bac1]SED17578.1 Phosphopantetheine attachment site [Pseudomonas costantinii]